MWSIFHLKKFSSRKKKHKNQKKYKFENLKKTSRDIDLKKTYTKFGEDWVIFRYRKIGGTKALQTDHAD